jgi:hypothetical protein
MFKQTGREHLGEMKCSKRRDREEEEGERFQTDKKQANILSEISTFL